MSVELEGLLGDCADAGIVFYLSGGSVTLRMNKGAVSPALLERIKRHKDGIKVWMTTAFSVARCVECKHSPCLGDGCLVSDPNASDLERSTPPPG